MSRIFFQFTLGVAAGLIVYLLTGSLIADGMAAFMVSFAVGRLYAATN